MSENLVWIRGKIVPETAVSVSALSPTAQFGLNVFEGIRCYWSGGEKILYAFRLKDHLDRLMQSCRLMSLVSPYTVNQIEDFISKTITANQFQGDVAVRVTIFGDGIGTWSASEPLAMFIAPIPKVRTNLSSVVGLRACISSWGRINDNVLPPRAKVGANYINGRYAQLQAQRDGYDVPIFLGADGKVSEGAGACIFMVRGGSLVTPPSTSSILEGITRNTIMDLASAMGIKIVERTIDRTELYIAEEIFFCGTAAEITPIISVDHFKIGDGNPGPISLELLRQYLSITSGIDNRYSEWRTAIYQAP